MADPEVTFGTDAILLPDMSNSDWEAECKRMYERQFALARFLQVIKGEIVEDFGADEFLDIVEHYGINPETYCQEVSDIVEAVE